MKSRAFARLYYSRVGHHAIEGARWHLRRSRADKASWHQREALLLECSDNTRIPRASDAGRIINGCLLMHNGIRVRPDSYYNYAALRMMQRNRGVHEPQEEAVFQEVVPSIPPGSTMVELGAYWAFYSIWFARTVRDAKLVMVEPMGENLDIGRENCRLNKCDGTFVHAFVGGPGDQSPELEVPLKTVDQLVSEQKLDRIQLLHADIQGHESRMLEGCSRSFAANIVDWVFLSTHSAQLHCDCLEALRRHGFMIVAQHDKEDSFSGDGLIVAKRPGVAGPDFVPIATRREGAISARKG